MRTIPIFVAVFILTIVAFAQQPAPVTPAGPSQEDISGMYSFLHEGEFVQVTVEDGNYVTGFVSRCEDENCKGVFVDHFFKTASLSADLLKFETKKLHGVWFEFDGKIAHNPEKKPGEEGYRLLRGKLVRHRTDADGKETAESRQVEFKSFPQDEQ